MLKRVIPFIAAGILGLGAVFAMQYVLQRERQALERERKKLFASYQPPVEIIVASRDLEAGTELAREDLARKPIPRNFIQPYATAQSAEVVGLMTRAPIAEGEQILRNKLQRPQEIRAGKSLSHVTPEGKRAITIGADVLTGVGGFVRPGDRVDILWTFQAPTPGAQAGEGELVTVTLFQGVEVLAVDDQVVGKASDDQAAGRDYTVTLALVPQQAEILLFAREQGRLQLSLRRRDDEAPVTVAPANIALLMEAILGPEAVQGPPPPPRRTVEVYKGLERNVVSVNE